MVQPFKETDLTESKMTNAVSPVLELLGSERDTFFNNAYESYPLGDVLYLQNRDPMVGVILPETFRVAYPAIHELFTRPATFEFYLSVFRAVWGASADITFSIPEPGRLVIGIEALTLELQEFLARRIENNTYLYDTVITQTGDTLVFQGTQGIKTQREAEALVNELSANGIVTEINLTVTP